MTLRLARRRKKRKNRPVVSPLSLLEETLAKCSQAVAPFSHRIFNICRYKLLSCAAAALAVASFVLVTHSLVLVPPIMLISLHKQVPH